MLSIKMQRNLRVCIKVILKVVFCVFKIQQLEIILKCSVITNKTYITKEQFCVGME